MPPRSTSYTLDNLQQWSSCSIQKRLPEVDAVKSIYLFDFDNTLFCTPLPNPALWEQDTLNQLQNPQAFADGSSWWHFPSILAATGKGFEKEQETAWEGWWNENIVQLVKLSMEQEDAFTVLLTGRSDARYTPLIEAMVSSKKLDFDMICCKPSKGPDGQPFSSTMVYKQALIQSLMHTYNQADEIRIYEDRTRHIEKFRSFLNKLNRTTFPSTGRKRISYQVIEVAEMTRHLDPVAEVAEVQRMVNAHNELVDNAVDRGGSAALTDRKRLQVKRTIFFTGYFLSNSESERITNHFKNFISPPPPFAPSMPDIRFIANNILITPQAASKDILDKVGGLGNKVAWRITDTTVHENRLWAARVTPVDSSQSIHTDLPQLVLIIAAKRSSRPGDSHKIRHWKRVAEKDALVFETTVGYRMLLRIEDELASAGPRKKLGRKKHNHQHQSQKKQGQASGTSKRGLKRKAESAEPDAHSGPYPKGPGNAGMDFFPVENIPEGLRGAAPTAPAAAAAAATAAAPTAISANTAANRGGGFSKARHNTRARRGGGAVGAAGGGFPGFAIPGRNQMAMQQQQQPPQSLPPGSCVPGGPSYKSLDDSKPGGWFGQFPPGPAGGNVGGNQYGSTPMMDY